MSAHTEDAGAFALLRAKGSVPVGPIFHNGRNGRERLTVIDNRRATIQTDRCRKWRLQTRVAAPALQRLHQRALFTTDIRARPSMHNHIQRKTAAQNVLPDIAGSIGFLNGAFHLPPCQCQFAAHINKGRRNTAGIAGDNHALNQLMRVLLHNHAVFEGSRLALVRIAAQVAQLIILSEKAPFHAGGEACASTPAQAGLLDHLDQVIGLVFFQRLL